VLSRDHVFITAKEKGVLYTVCLDRKTGRELWRRESARAPQPEPKTKLALAAPSPATDGANVYVAFDEFGLISYDGMGRERWRKPLTPLQTPYGFGSSPVIERTRAGAGLRVVPTGLLCTGDGQQAVVGERHGVAGEVAAGARRWHDLRAFIDAGDA
jgi:hypothetical protein